jgi:hypothetical protein
MPKPEEKSDWVKALEELNGWFVMNAPSQGAFGWSDWMFTQESTEWLLRSLRGLLEVEPSYIVDVVPRLIDRDRLSQILLEIDRLAPDGPKLQYIRK